MLLQRRFNKTERFYRLPASCFYGFGYYAGPGVKRSNTAFW